MVFGHLVGEHLAGAQVLDLEQVALVADGVGAERQQLAVGAHRDRAEREEVVALGELVGVEQHLLAGYVDVRVELGRGPVVRAAGGATAARAVLLVLVGAPVVPPVADPRRHRQVGLLGVGADLLEDLRAQLVEVGGASRRSRRSRPRGRRASRRIPRRAATRSRRRRCRRGGVRSVGTRRASGGPAGLVDGPVEGVASGMAGSLRGATTRPHRPRGFSTGTPPSCGGSARFCGLADTSCGRHAELAKLLEFPCWEGLCGGSQRRRHAPTHSRQESAGPIGTKVLTVGAISPRQPGDGAGGAGESGRSTGTSPEPVNCGAPGTHTSGGPTPL